MARQNKRIQVENLCPFIFWVVNFSGGVYIDAFADVNELITGSWQYQFTCKFPHMPLFLLVHELNIVSHVPLHQHSLVFQL